MNRHLPTPWDLDDRMTVVLFAGMGGGCDGLEAAGFHVHVAINHDPVAVAVHEKRHPHTKHLRCDVFEADPRAVTKGRGVRILHASPDCTHFSVAKGSKPVSKRRRSLAWVVCRWMGQAAPEVVTLENVAEIQTWGPLIAKRDKATGRVLRLDGSVAGKGERVPLAQQWLVPDPRHKGRIWRAWLRHVEHLGYRFESRVLVCADYGVPTIRKRLFGVARADGGAIAWPARSHAPRAKARALGLKPWVGANTIIDWSLPVKSIFSRKKPLADATLRRTARGVMRYVVEAAKPFIVPITHAGDNRVHSVDEPLRTLTTAHRGELSVVVPHVAKFRTGATGADILEPLPTVTANSFEKRPGGAIPLGLVGASLIQTGYGERDGQAPRVPDIGEPAGTQVAGGGKAALVAAFLAQNNTGEPGRPADLPLSTIVAKGSTQGVVAVHLQRQFGASVGADAEEPAPTVTVGGSGKTALVAAALGDMHGSRDGARPADEPLATVAAGGNHAHLILAFLQTYYGSGDNNHALRDPLHTVTLKERHALVTVRVKGVPHYIDDIGIRMLEPEEGAAAHGFRPDALPAEIVLDGKPQRLTKTQKYHLVGNSVPPRMIELLARANGRSAMAATLQVAAE